MRLTYLKQLLDLTKRQKVLLEVDEYEEFINLLEERQKIIEQIELINSTEHKQLTTEERSILEQLIKEDKENTKEYNKQLKETKQKLKKLNENINREKQYIGNYLSFSTGRHFDNK